jgi:hypothetical protein
MSPLVGVELDRAGPASGELSRQALLRRGAGAVAAMSGLYAFGPQRARAVASDATGPKPIPGGFSASFKPVASNAVAHVFQPAKGVELNTIGDFDGFVAATEIQGKAKGSDGTAYSFDCDMRFMHGSYVALDGHLKQGTFGFI